MALSPDRYDDDMMIQCPRCSRMMIRKGRLIKSVKSLTCEGCDNQIQMTYSRKIDIFERRRRSHPWPWRPSLPIGKSSSAATNEAKGNGPVPSRSVEEGLNSGHH